MDMNRIWLPASRQAITRALEPMWVAALGIQLIAGGALLLPLLIRMLGRGGAVETVEWAVYMSVLVVFPVLVLLVGWVMPAVAGVRSASVVKRGLVLLLVAAFAIYAVYKATPLLVLAGVAAALGSLALLLVRSSDRVSGNIGPVAFTSGLAGWMAGGGLVYWQNAASWMTASPLRFVLAVAIVLVAAASLRAWIVADSASSPIRVLDFIPIAILVAFSFRTYPMVEHYHWGFFVGPIEQLRQGGSLLWDTPSQYGFLSILLPAILPGDAWQSFWFFQGATCAVVASLMYLGIRRLSPGWPTALMAFAITFTTLFFRPRTDSLILPAQMTPAAGPFRFIWCFVMIAFLVSAVSNGKARAGTRHFAAAGTIIWIVAVAWSAETAIYVTAMWFPALLIHALQTAAASRFSVGRFAAAAARAAVYPAAAVIAAAMVVIGSYRIAGRPGPDFSGHLEYVLLYSRGGFGALPIDPTGTIWYLIVSFLIVSTIFVLHARRDPLDSRLIVWAAAAGGTWAVSSYFTGRSHPVNLIALIPVLVYTIVACMRLRPFAKSSRGRYALAASMLPLLSMPVILNAGHRAFASAASEEQLAPRDFVEQVQRMDPELEKLLLDAGARPQDSFVLASDGRLMLGAWNTGDSGSVVSARSWLPKPFEIIGSLPEERRQQYFDRNARSFASEGWLITSKTLEANGGNHLEEFAESSRAELRRLESANWIVRLLGPAAPPGG